MKLEPLKKIGLTDSEIRVYLSLLKLGQTTAGPIVNEAKVTRSKIYDILERLKNKGLVSFITRESTKHFSASSPENILEYLNNKEKEIKEEKVSIEKMLPELLNQQRLANNKKLAEVFVGIKGMENAFNALVNEFDSSTPYYAFGAGKGENVGQIQLFFSRLHQKRIEKKVKAYIIFNESSRGFFKSQEKSKFVEARYITQSTPAAINIYKDYTIIALLSEEPITFLIKNSQISKSFIEYFKTIWGLAKR